MFTTEEINNLRQEYIKYTTYSIPEIQSIVYEDTKDFYGKVNYEDISSNNYVIHFSNDLNDCPVKFQKSIVYHEFTHIYDLTSNASLTKNQIDGFMHTFSEAHAESIKLRYLLSLDIKRKINQGVRYLENYNGKSDIGTVTSTYLNQSLTSYGCFIKNPLPKHFYNFLHSYCHFCGYLTIRTPKDAKIILNGVLNKFPIQYCDDLRKLCYSIERKDIQECCEIYSKLQLKALKTTDIK